LRKLNETEAFKNNRIKVFITELDIDVLNFEEGTCPEINSETNVGKELADQYAELFKLFIKYSDIISRVSFWGLHDGKSWLNTKFNCQQTNHPLLWDRDLHPKQALFAILDVAKNRKGCEVLVANPK
jgi:endo-1,4-beta-xylanase